MNIPINITMWVIAILPMIALLVLMLKKKWSVSKASPVGLIIAILGAMFFYKAPPKLLLVEMGKGLWNSITIVLVIFTALLIYEVTNESKAFISIKNTLKQVAPNELVRILGIGMVFVSFLQGVTGFGVPVAVSAPILIGIGVKPLWAVIVPLLGHAWAGTFGTLAVAWDALVIQSEINEIALINSTAFYATAFIWIINITYGLSICWFYGKKEGIKKGILPVFIFSIIQGGGQLLIAQFNSTISCFLSTCVALVAFFLLNKLSIYKEYWSIKDSPIMDREYQKEEEISTMGVIESFLPYILMTMITLLILLTPFLKEILGRISFSFSFPETATGYDFVNQAQKNYSPFVPFTHASIFLFLSALGAYTIYIKKGYININSTKNIIKRALKKTIPSSLAVISLTMMSRVMGGSGQILVLATALSNILGENYALISPFIGLLGSFITGSNMSCNILFAELQYSTSNLLSLNTASILGVHTAAASIGTSISPSNIILGATTAGILGNEGNILKKTLPVCIILTILFGISVWVINVI